MAKRRSSKFDDDAVRKLTIGSRHPEKDEVLKEGSLYAVPHLPNLFIRFGKRAKTYTAVAREPGGRQVWTTIGRTDKISLKAAEDETDRIVERIRAGQSLAAVPAAETLAGVVEAYEKKVGRHQRQWHNKKQRLAKWILPRFGKRMFISIKRSEVNALLNEIESDKSADQVLMDLYALEKHFLKMDTIPDDYDMRFRGGLVPRRSTPNPRERVLKPHELRAIWIAAGTASAGRFGVVVKLCLLTAQRITKILSMQWDHVNLETGEWEIPRAPREKGVPKILPLPPQAIELIKTQQHLTPYVFYSVRGTGYMWGLSEMKRNFEAQLPPMAQWGLHDLRRSARTWLSELDVPPHIGEKILGHSLKGVMAVYDKSNLVPQMKDALLKLARYIEDTVTEAPMALAG